MTEYQRCFGKTEREPFLFFIPEGEQRGTASLASISFSLLKGREGQRHRGITAESVAARNQTTAGFIHELESRRLHAARCAGFYWPFSITPVTQDWVCRSASFSWKGQSRLWGQARLKWNNQWNGNKYNALLSECKLWLNYKWLYGLLPTFLSWNSIFQTILCHKPLKRHTVSSQAMGNKHWDETHNCHSYTYSNEGNWGISYGTELLS